MVSLLLVSIITSISLLMNLILGINITDIQYHYALLCGQSGGGHNSFRLPVFSNEIGLCPICSNDNSCWLNNSCCPETELKYQPRVCEDNVLYRSGKSTINDISQKYMIIKSCPEDTDIELARKCSEELDFPDIIRNTPVTATDTYITFKNIYCAKCNGVDKYIPWKIDVKCDKKFDPFSNLEDIIDNILENECSVYSIPDVILTSYIEPCEKHNLINQCNITDTWVKYNENIDYACRKLNNMFPPYNNVFCYICNPPNQTLNETIKTCSDNYYWNKTPADVQLACKSGGLSEATYPYQNVYCFMCNSDYKVNILLRPYSSSVSDSGKVTYNVIDTNIYDGFEGLNGIVVPVFNICSVNYGAVRFKIECLRAIPISLFSENATKDIMEYDTSEECNITEIENGQYVACQGHECNNETTVEVLWACETSSSEVYYSGRKSSNLGQDVFISGKCGLPILIGKNDQLDEDDCDVIRCKARQYINPIHYAFCDCCSSVEYKDTVFAGNFNLIPAIFNSNFYSPDCTDSEIYDTVMNVCRATDCYVGKHLHYSRCHMLLPLSRYQVELQYILPLSFNTDEDHENITRLLHDFVSDTFGANVEFCLMSMSAYWHTPSSTYIAFVTSSGRGSIVDTENELINITSGLSKVSFKNLFIAYDYRTFRVNITDSISVDSNTCRTGNGKKHLVTELLTCRHVLFSSNEYIVSSDRHKVELPIYGSELQFYEYEIDEEKKLRICIERFDRIIDSLKRGISVYTIVMIICTSISLLCLLLTLLTYCIFPSLRTLPGKNILNMVVSLVLFHSFYMVLMIMEESENAACKFVGIMTHFSVLSCFGSFTVCTVHMFRIFGQTKLSSTVMGQSGNRLFCLYLLFAYGSSTTIVTSNIVVIYITSGMTSIGYGRNGKCFVSAINSFIITVLVPLVITFVVNFALYIITTYRLKKKVELTAKLTNNTNHSKKEFVIFIRLFLTTGCSWILLLINFLVNEIAIYVAISGLNTLQGILIFIAYICNKRTFNMYGEKFFGKSDMISRRNTKSSKSTYVSSKFENGKDNMGTEENKNNSTEHNEHLSVRI